KPQPDQDADLVGGAERLQPAEREQGQRQPDESAADGDDRQRAAADLVDLAHQLGEEVRGRLRRAQHRQREHARAADGAGGIGEGHQAALSRGAASNAIGPSGSPSRNWRTSGSWLACSSSGAPENTIRPLASTSARSAIARLSRTWWVTTMLVRPRVWLRREIRPMITPIAIGSSPVS